MKRLLLIAAVALVLVVPAATHPGGQYYTPSYARQQLQIYHGMGSGTCYGRTDSEHGHTQWPPNYLDRYQKFACEAVNWGTQVWHVNSSGGMVHDWSMPA